MSEDLVICEIRIDEAPRQSDSDSRMTSFEVMLFALKSTMKVLL